MHRVSLKQIREAKGMSMADAGLPEFLQDHPEFTVLGTVGHGGMGTVYLAEQRRLSRRVAIKVLAGALAEDPRTRERFLRETKAVASIDHPGVLPIYDVGAAGPALFSVMRFVDGPDLRKYLTESGRMQLDEVRRIGLQVSDALGAAHARALVHRDVKPANILLAPHYSSGTHTYLCDFGLAKRLDSGSSLTKMDEIVGTVDYIAPEQIEGRTVDARTDIYSLACILYEMLVGHTPFQGYSDIAVLWCHLRDEPPSVRKARPELPRQLGELLQSAMAKSPNDRPSSTSEFADALVACDDTPTVGRFSEALNRSKVRGGDPNAPSPVGSFEQPLGPPGASVPPIGTDNGGSSEEDDGGRSQAHRRSRWLIGTTLLIAALAVTGVLLGLNSGGNSSSGQPSTDGSMHSMGTGGTPITGPFPTLAEKALESRLAADVGKTCSRYADLKEWSGATAGLECKPPHGASDAVYLQLNNGNTMMMHYNHLREEEAIGAPAVTWCPAAPNFTGTEAVTRSAPAGTGKQFCFLQDNGDPQIVWTSDHSNVLSWATRTDKDSNELWSWWFNEGGPN